VRLLDARFLVHLAKAEDGRLAPRAQLPDAAFFDLPRLKREQHGSVEGTLRILIVSMPSLASEHPDPAGVLLKRLGRVLDSFVEDDGGSYAVLLRYCCVADAADAPEQHQKAMAGLCALFSHDAIPVLLLSALPSEKDEAGACAAAYEALGWTAFEARVAKLTKPPRLVLDLSKFEDDEEAEEPPFLDGLVESCRARNLPPLLPADLRQLLSGKAFVRPADAELLGEVYEAFFLKVFPSVEALVYDSNEWVDDDIAALCKTLSGIEMGGVRQMWLSKNSFTDAGMKMIEASLKGGALPNIEDIHMYGLNKAGFPAREAIAAVREGLSVHYDGMGGARENHIQ